MTLNTTPHIKTLQEAFAYFSDRQRCIDYVVSLRWPDGKVACPVCGSEAVTWLPTRFLFQCKGKHPKRQFSVKVGTLMEDSPIPLGDWLLVGWMLTSCRNGVSSYEIARTIGITQKSAWFMLHRLREGMQTPLSPDKFTGEVEADETYVGGKSRNMHLKRRKKVITHPGVHNKIPVMGLLERGGDVRAMVIPNHKRRHLQNEISKHVESGSTLYTDDLHSYRKLPGYEHGFVDHATKFVSGPVHTNGLENFWSCLKRALKGTYVAVSPKHLNSYVAEQVFRFNVRKGFTEEQRGHVLMHGMQGKRLTYSDLIARTV